MKKYRVIMEGNEAQLGLRKVVQLASKSNDYFAARRASVERGRERANIVTHG